jgi:hypothetical protein
VAFGAGVVGVSAVFCEAAVVDKEKSQQATSKASPEIELVDISNLQKWDSNWDGRLVHVSCYFLEIDICEQFCKLRYPQSSRR